MTYSHVHDRGRTMTATRVGLSSECRAAADAALMRFASGSFVGQSFPMGSVGDHRCAGSSAPAHYWADVHARRRSSCDGVGGNEAGLVGQHYGVHAVADSELGEEAIDVGLDCCLAEDEVLGDFVVG